MLVSTGAEAVENAVKIARYATGRQAVVVFDHAFHGRTLLAMTMTAKAMPYKSGLGPFAPEVYRLPMSYPYRCPTGAAPEACATSCAEEAIHMMDKQIAADRIAAIVLEPIQGEGGFVVPGAGFVAAIAGYEPDLVTTAKSLAGGLPLAGITGRADLMDSVHVGGLGGTFAGNPLACAASLAVLDAMEREGWADRAARLEPVILGRLNEMAERYPVIGDVRGRGMMCAIELVEDRSTKTPAKNATNRVLAAALADGVVLLKCGTYDNVVRLLPPLTIDEGLLHDGLDVLEKALATV
jgi:4-aminobutyrate aminotransferase/(S)-3-amino-2-methylpropionate transaminase